MKNEEGPGAFFIVAWTFCALLSLAATSVVIWLFLAVIAFLQRH